MNVKMITLIMLAAAPLPAEEMLIDLPTALRLADRQNSALALQVERLNRADLEVDAASVLVLQNAGPKGVPGFPEWGMIPLPKKLLQQGLTDIVRISDVTGTGHATSFIDNCVFAVMPIVD